MKLSYVMACAGIALVVSAVWFLIRPTIGGGYAMAWGIVALMVLGAISGAVDKWPSSPTTSRPRSMRLE